MLTRTQLTAIATTGAAIVAALAVGFLVLGQQSPAPEPVLSPTPTATPTVPTAPESAVAPAEQAAADALGAIAGRKIFPGEAIPGDFRVCAANVSTGQETCGEVGAAPTYSLTVPAGSYQVYAVVPSFDPGFRAYYSRFITCGLRVECTDHSPITVTVTAGQVLDGIDVGDFYD